MGGIYPGGGYFGLYALFGAGEVPIAPVISAIELMGTYIAAISASGTHVSTVSVIGTYNVDLSAVGEF